MRNVRAVLRRDGQGVRLSVVFPAFLCDMITVLIFVVVVVLLVMWLGPETKAILHTYIQQLVAL